MGLAKKKGRGVFMRPAGQATATTTARIVGVLSSRHPAGRLAHLIPTNQPMTVSDCPTSGVAWPVIALPTCSQHLAPLPFALALASSPASALVFVFVLALAFAFTLLSSLCLLTLLMSLIWDDTAVSGRSWLLLLLARVSRPCELVLAWRGAHLHSGEL